MKKTSKKQRNEFYRQALEEILRWPYDEPIFTSIYPEANTFAEFGRDIFEKIIKTDYFKSLIEVSYFLNKRPTVSNIEKILSNKENVIFILSIMIEMTK